VLLVVLAGEDETFERNETFERKEDLKVPRKENPTIPLDMGRDTNAGHAGRGGNSGRGGRGQGGRGRGASTTVPRKASEVGACKTSLPLALATRARMETC